MRVRYRTVIGWLVVLVLLALFGFAIFLDAVIAFFFGWILFLWRTLPRIRPDWEQIVMAIGSAAFFAVALHAFCGWIYREFDRNKKGPESSSPSSWQPRWTAQIVAGFICLFAAGTAMIGITHQLVWLATSDEPIVHSAGSARIAARRNSSTQHARWLGIAATNHESHLKTLPPGCTTDERGRLLHGWQALLLPYLEESFLHDKIDFDSAWNSERNAELFQQRMDMYEAPLPLPRYNDDGFALTHYSANVHVMGGNRGLTEKDLPNGYSKTLLFGEIRDQYPAWGSPTNWRDPLLGLNESPNGFGSFWPGGIVIFARADGSSGAYSADIDPKVLRALSTGGRIKGEG